MHDLQSIWNHMKSIIKKKQLMKKTTNKFGKNMTLDGIADQISKNIWKLLIKTSSKIIKNIYIRPEERNTILLLVS